VTLAAVDEFEALLAPGPLPGGSAVPPAAVTVPATAGGDRAMGGYEAADQYDQSLARWAPQLQSVDLDILFDKPIVDARARDMLRNDAFVQGGASLHKDNIVGSIYSLNARPSSKVIFGKLDDTWEEEFQEEVEEKWDLVAESPDNWLDAQRTNTFTSMVRLFVGISLAAGEALAAVEWIPEGRPFSTAIQFIDLDRLSDDPMRGFLNNQDTRAGVRFDKRGAPIAYSIRTEHPNDVSSLVNTDLPVWKEIPRQKPWGRLQIIHIFEQVRPDQSRGISEMAAALREMKFAKKFRDVQLQRAVMQSLYAATITSEMPTAQVFAQLGGTGVSSDNTLEAVTAYATGFLGAVNEYTGAAKQIRLDGARIPHLFPGTKMEMLSPTNGVGVGQEFEQSLLRYIAASMGVSYEQLSRDYTNTNYSSARAAMTETWKFMQSRKKLVADRFASIVYRLWLEEAINKGEITAFDKRRAKTLYTRDSVTGISALNLKFDAISRADWIGASRGQIDELKETQAAVLRMNNGLSTLEEESARLGGDYRKRLRTIARINALKKKLGVEFAVDQQLAASLSSEPTDEPAPRKAA